MAIRSPGHAELADDVHTNVNLFPTLFDAYLGTKLARQPNLSYRPDGLHEVH